MKQKTKTFFSKLKTKLFSWHSLVCLAIVIGIVFWDLLTKSITDGFNIPVIKNVLSFFSTHNTGGAWSVFSSLTWLLILISSIIIIGILVFDIIFMKKRTKLYTVALAFIIGGAFGNLIDRIFKGYVRDFIKLDFINFPIFNLADICLFVGVVLMCIFIIFQSNKNSNKTEINQKKEDKPLEKEAK